MPEEDQNQQTQSDTSTSSEVQYDLPSGTVARLVHPTPVIHVRIMVDPNEAASFDDKFTLKSTDGQYSRQMTVKNDVTPGDEFVDLIFDNLKTGCNYTLEIDPGAEGDPYDVFTDVPFAEIVKHYAIIEDGDDIEEPPEDEEEDIGDAESEDVDWDDEEDSEQDEGGDPEDLDDEFDTWTEDEYEEFGDSDEWGQSSSSTQT